MAALDFSVMNDKILKLYIAYKVKIFPLREKNNLRNYLKAKARKFSFVHA